MVAIGTAGGRNNLTPDDIGRYLLAYPELAGMSPDEIIQVIVLRQFLVMYLILPLIIPTSIATASIIGEKVLRSLEPLLATPIRTVELLLAKAIAAVVPAVAATWLAYGIFYVGSHIIVQSARVQDALLNSMWLLAILILAPLLSLLSVSLSVIISSRVNDPRVAQQLAGLVVIPLVLVGVAQTAGFVVLNVAIFSVVTALIALIDVVVLYIGVQLFERETILTRWK